MLVEKAGIVWELVDGSVEEGLVEGVIPSIPIVFSDTME
jgi:hypothetical protein